MSVYPNPAHGIIGANFEGRMLPQGHSMDKARVQPWPYAANTDSLEIAYVR